MSFMKALLMQRLDTDLIELGKKAAGSGRLPTFEERIAALTEVFEECGQRANAYPCPDMAAQQLVTWAAMDYRISRAKVRGMESTAG